MDRVREHGGQPQCGLLSSPRIFIRLSLSEVERMRYLNISIGWVISTSSMGNKRDGTYK